MKGEPIPPEDHVVLHCEPSGFGLDLDELGNPVGVTFEVFRVDDDGISTNWLEYSPGSLDQRFAAACLAMAFRTIRKRHRVGTLNVGAVVARTNAPVVHDPIDEPPNPSHALITGVHPDNKVLLQTLAVMVTGNGLREFTPEALEMSKKARR